MMNERALIQQWEQEAQEPFAGWDFSHLANRYHEERPPWSYEERVRRALQSADSLLDMGTGGGEKLLEFRDLLPQNTIATEGYLPNLPVASANLAQHHIPVVAYNSEADARMPFADGSFACIINRHESFDAGEVARVLRPGGVFCTQQVDGRDMNDLYARFGVETAYAHVNLEEFRQRLEAAGLHIQEALDWQGTARFSDVGALVYYLHAVPWEAPADFSVQRYQQQLLDLHALPTLEFTIRRFYLQAVKWGQRKKANFCPASDCALCPYNAL